MWEKWVFGEGFFSGVLLAFLARFFTGIFHQSRQSLNQVNHGSDKSRYRDLLFSIFLP